MSNINTLIKRDFLEFRNEPKKFIGIIIAFFFPALSLISKDSVITNKQLLVTLMFIVIPIYICYITTLSQTVMYIKNGIYEQYFLNSNIKKYQIVVSKFVVNLILSMASCCISFMLIFLFFRFGLAKGMFDMDYMIFVYSTLSCYIASAIGIIAATIMKSEKSFSLYVLLLIMCFLPMFIVFNKMGYIPRLFLVVYMFVGCLIATFIVTKMYESSRFINRGV